ncbi:MAG: PQQ-binding-like beta-propeller repeat protein [Phycisphaeraceae bacterium]
MSSEMRTRGAAKWVSGFVAAIVMISVASDAVAQPHWPDYRGPNTQGHAPWADLPTTWSEDQNVTWKVAIPHRGWSSPVVHGNQIWMTTATRDGQDLFAICVDLKTGELLHNFKVFDHNEPDNVNTLNSHASPSPVIEEGRVYVHFGDYGTAAIDTASAEVVWERRDLNLTHFEGAGSSPILYEDMLIFHCDGTDVQYVVALNKHTGETVWKTDRSRDMAAIRMHRRKAYTTPVVWEIEGKPQLLSQGAEAMYSYDPHTGEELWRVIFSGYSTVPRPVIGDGALYISTGFDQASLLRIRLDGSRGDLTDTHIEWQLERSQIPHRPSFLLIDGLIYTVSDNGIGQAIEAETGEVIWRERFGGQYSASPIYDGQHIYFFSQEGDTIVFPPGREFNQVAHNQLDAGFMASPAVVDNTLILRTETHLYRIDP